MATTRTPLDGAWIYRTIRCLCVCVCVYCKPTWNTTDDTSYQQRHMHTQTLTPLHKYLHAIFIMLKISQDLKGDEIRPTLQEPVDINTEATPRCRCIMKAAERWGENTNVMTTLTQAAFTLAEPDAFAFSPLNFRVAPAIRQLFAFPPLCGRKWVTYAP